ncbi:MAG TPA: hypothetical protein VG708_01130 [Mycobacteriales bacterium]|nr:hypothetical protein [Mycobacteriales bacterium]
MRLTTARLATGFALAALVVVPAIGTAAPAAAATTTFSGSCNISGELFYPVSGSGHVGPETLLRADGVCNGSLDGGPSASHPVTGGGWTVDGQFLAQLSYMPLTASGVGSFTFANGETLEFSMQQILLATTVTGQGGGFAIGTISGWGGDTAHLSLTTLGPLTSG